MAPGAGGRYRTGDVAHLFAQRRGLYQAHLDDNHNSGQYRADAVFSGSDHSLTLSLVQRDAAYDVNTIASLFDAVRGNGYVFLTYQQRLTERWRLSVMGGISGYSGTSDGISPDTAQRRFGVRLNYAVTPDFTAGYYARGSSFTQASPLVSAPRITAPTVLRMPGANRSRRI